MNELEKFSKNFNLQDKNDLMLLKKMIDKADFYFLLMMKKNIKIEDKIDIMILTPNIIKTKQQKPDIENYFDKAIEFLQEEKSKFSTEYNLQLEGKKKIEEWSDMKIQEIKQEIKNKLRKIPF